MLAGLIRIICSLRPVVSRTNSFLRDRSPRREARPCCLSSGKWFLFSKPQFPLLYREEAGLNDL